MSLHPPAAWIARFAPIVPRRHGILDVAAGAGRHARHFASLGHLATAVDVDVRGMNDLANAPDVAVVQADLEGGPWPFADRVFDAVVVANYLHRPLFGRLIDAVAPGGWLIYETFMAGNEAFGRPSNPAYLLQSGELLDIVAGRLTPVAFEQGEIASPRAAVVQRIAAINGPGPAPLPSP